VEETGPSAPRMTGRLRGELGGMECELHSAWWHDGWQWNRKELKESEEVGGRGKAVEKRQTLMRRWESGAEYPISCRETIQLVWPTRFGQKSTASDLAVTQAAPFRYLTGVVMAITGPPDYSESFRTEVKNRWDSRKIRGKNNVILPSP
jgi:hypothetical protein